MLWKEDPAGVYPKVPWFDWSEIETKMEEVLEEAGWPTLDERPAIDIEKILTKWGLDPDYRDLPEDIHGRTGPNGKGELEIFISADLAESAQKNPNRIVRLRSTIAHEFGHYLLHQEVLKSVAGQFLCRETQIASIPDSGEVKGGREWMEQQANRAMASLLMPRKSLRRVAIEMHGCKDETFTSPEGARGDDLLLDLLSGLFEVSRTFAENRLNSIRHEATAETV